MWRPMNEHTASESHHYPSSQADIVSISLGDPQDESTDIPQSPNISHISKEDEKENSYFSFTSKGMKGRSRLLVKHPQGDSQPKL